MSTTFDPEKIDKLGWRQGAVLGTQLRGIAQEHAPKSVTIADADWLILTSHDCDVVARKLEKEPVVEVLRGEVLARKVTDKQQAWGRNPRELQFSVTDAGSGTSIISVKVHERWTLPRQVLELEAPAGWLGEKERRLVAEWLAKRYIRAAFPTAFDGRWRAKMKEWTTLLEKHSRWIQGVYLRLSTLRELDDAIPYKVHLIIAVPAGMKKEGNWATTRDQLDRDVESFWSQFTPSIEFVDVDVLGTDEVTLADIEMYQRFDADWVSFADDSPATPASADLTA